MKWVKCDPLAEMIDNIQAQIIHRVLVQMEGAAHVDFPKF